MTDDLRLMAVLAHPDDESLGLGGVLARYNHEGVKTTLVTATRGERGRYGDLPERPSLEEVGRMREKELRSASIKLGIREIEFLDYIDGDLDRADPQEAISKIVHRIHKHRPQVVLTFGPEGAYGHPDHIAISQFTTAAITASADPNFSGHKKIEIEPDAHRVSKLYYMAMTDWKWEAFTSAFRDIRLEVDGVKRRALTVPDWFVSAEIDTGKYREQVWSAIQCHKTQLTIYKKLADLSEEDHLKMWGSQHFYRAFSLVNGGRQKETDLFEGLR